MAGGVPRYGFARSSLVVRLAAGEPRHFAHRLTKRAMRIGDHTEPFAARSGRAVGACRSLSLRPGLLLLYILDPPISFAGARVLAPSNRAVLLGAIPRAGSKSNIFRQPY